LRSESQNLKQIFTSIYSKVRSIQNNSLFDKPIEKEVNKTYIGMTDNYFFRQLCDLIFQSGVRGAVWQKYELEMIQTISVQNKSVLTWKQEP